MIEEYDVLRYLENSFYILGLAYKVYGTGTMEEDFTAQFNKTLRNYPSFNPLLINHKHDLKREFADGVDIAKLGHHFEDETKTQPPPPPQSLP